MTEVTGDPGLGTAPTSPQPVYAFNTDSLQALGMVVDLLDQGATVSRAKVPFDAGGAHFGSGAALVDGGTIRLDQLAADARRRETPVFGLPGYPVDRYPTTKPKVALYTGSDKVPSNPLDPGHGTGQCVATSFCEAYFALTQQARIPASQVVPVTSTDLSDGVLEGRGFTALVDANATVGTSGSPTSPAVALRKFVNRGGNFVT